MLQKNKHKKNLNHFKNKNNTSYCITDILNKKNICLLYNKYVDKKSEN